MSDKLLTADELAELIGVTTRTIKTWLGDNIIPAAVREGNVLRFDEAAVRKALAKRAATRTHASRPVADAPPAGMIPTI
jgi:excisionase family DNA binding protein